MKRRILTSVMIAFSILIGSSTFAITDSEPPADKTSKNGVIYLDAESFKEQVFNYETNKEWNYNGKVPAILDFYADWCGPCKMLSPVLEKIQKEYDGKIQIYKVDTDEQKELAAAFGIRSLPTIVLIPLNEDPQATLGYKSQNELEEMISEILKVEK